MNRNGLWETYAMATRPVPSLLLLRSCTRLFIAVCGLAGPVHAQSPSAVVTVDVGTVRMADSKRLLGTSFDGRTGVQMPSGPSTVPAGYFDVNNHLLPGVAPLWNQIRLTTVRYPGNATDQIDWRETVGPVPQRSPQPYSGNGTATQVIRFGFDDFMDMVATHNPPGGAPPEVQVMVSTRTSLTVPTQAEVIQMAADWVEYANAPNDSSNPGGGIDWAAQRAANGHPAPYDIRIWNVGNEPWGPSQPFDFKIAGNAAAFAALAQQFITAMKAIDPTILITIPSPARPAGNASELAAIAAWDNTMLAQLGSQIFGLSMHLFYDETSLRGISACSGAMDASLARIASSGSPAVRLLLGDHAHSIPNASTPALQDFGMQWLAAVTQTDLLLMAASKPLERVNFWIYGMPAAQWHPIRRNTDGTYTMMPSAVAYSQMAGSILDQALAVTTTSPASVDGTAGYSVRAGAFRSADGTRLSVVMVNRDTVAAQTVAIQGLALYQVTSGRLLTATGPTADNVIVTPLTLPVAGGLYAMPPSSILMLDAIPAQLVVPGLGGETRVQLSPVFPNPSSGEVRFDATVSVGAVVEILDTAGRSIRRLAVPGTGTTRLRWDLTNDAGQEVAPGIYFLRLASESEMRTRRVVVLHSMMR
jgi:alpha-L-arabinofuranosidase